MPSFTTFPRNQKKWGVSDWMDLKEKEDSPTEQKTTRSIQPRFSVFGNNKSKLAMINSRKSDTEPVKKGDGRTAKKKVTFDSVFLERVCLFHESQSPFELKGVREVASELQIVCPDWNTESKHIRLEKTCFSIQDNQYIKGQLMVRNLALDKSVFVRYTFDRWETVKEANGAFFGPNPKNVTFDIYDFTMDLGQGQLADRGEVRGRIEFTVRVTASTRDYFSRNYTIKLIAAPLNCTKDDDDDYYTTEEEKDEEKHNSFTNALKEYQHAKPIHLVGSKHYFQYPFIKPSSPPDHIQIIENLFILSNATPPTSPLISSKQYLPSVDTDSLHYLNRV